MSKFESLTNYIPELKHDKFDEWVVDKENNGTPEHPIQMPYVNYLNLVDAFKDDFSRVLSVNEEMGLHCYTNGLTSI